MFSKDKRSSSVTIVLVVLSIGALITLSATWTSWVLNRHNERRLLEVQTRQAGAVLSATILGISSPLVNAVHIAEATEGDPTQFSKSLSEETGPTGLFASAALWVADGSSVRQIVSVGQSPGLAARSPAAIAFVTRGLRSPTFVVTPITVGGSQRIGYAVANPKDPKYIVYAERTVPANRQVPAESNSAFADLDYATYLGKTTELSALETTDLPPSKLPLSGDTAREVIPFGDSSITLVTSPRSSLGGSLGRQLPWIFLVAGALLTLATAVAADQLVRRRRAAEQDASTIAGLYRELDGLYTDQRSIAETLQRALLPATNPAIPGLEIASSYVAGAVGVDIGGDWYGIVSIDARSFAFVVGDVSGRGISAATIMARLRFTLWAYLVEGHAPEAVLEMCSRQMDLSTDGHFATVVVGIGHLDSREITLANAGHLSPLVISDGGANYVETHVGLPLGVAPCAYSPLTFQMPTGSTLICFTDGLVERRGESIDEGLQRLASSAVKPDPTVADLVTRLVDELIADGSEDDVAILAFRWADQGSGVS